MSDDKLETAISRGVQAAALMRNELLQESLSMLEAEYIEAWRSTHFRDTEAREKLFLAVNIVRKVRDHLVTVSNNGKLAQRQLDEMIETKKREQKK